LPDTSSEPAPAPSTSTNSQPTDPDRPIE
jgi:hypothetical protein